jgi:hypothetical protein
MAKSPVIRPIKVPSTIHGNPNLPIRPPAK